MSGVKSSGIAPRRPLLVELIDTALLTAGRAVVPHPNYLSEES
jgi:hypothetical protein